MTRRKKLIAAALSLPLALALGVGLTVRRAGSDTLSADVCDKDLAAVFDDCEAGGAQGALHWSNENPSRGHDSRGHAPHGCGLPSARKAPKEVRQPRRRRICATERVQQAIVQLLRAVQHAEGERHL